MAELVAFDGATVTRMIEERRFDEAAAHVDEVLTSTPAHLPAMLARLRLFIALGQTAEAVELAERLAAKWPSNKWVSAAQVDALLAADKLADARNAFLAMASPTADDNALLSQMLNTLLQADPDRDSRIAMLTAATEAWPDSQAVLIKLAGQTYLAGRGVAAASLLARAETMGTLPPHARKLREALLATSGDHRGAADHLSASASAAETPGDSETTRRLIRMLAAAGDFDAAAGKLSEALDRWPQDWLVVYRLNRIFLSAERDAMLFAQLKATLDGGETSDLWRLQFAQFAQRAGHTDLATDIFRSLAHGSAASHIAAPNLAALDRALADGEGAPRIGLDMAKDFTLVRVDNAVATVVVFGSLVGGIGHLPFAVVDPVLARLPVNVVYLRDRYGLAFLRGVAGLGPNEAATVTALKVLVASLGAPRVITTGSSIAGYSATRYALAIGADATLSFAGPTTIGNDGSTSRSSSLGLEELQAIAKGSGDLSAAIAAADGFALTLVVGSDYAPDVSSAAASERLDNVTVVTLPGVEHHYAALAAITEGRYLPLLESVISPESADEPH